VFARNAMSTSKKVKRNYFNFYLHPINIDKATKTILNQLAFGKQRKSHWAIFQMLL